MTLRARIGIAVFAALLSCMPAMAATVEVSFLLVNDVDQMSETNGRGGYARVAAAVRTERAARENLFVVHGGDAISPSLLSGFDQGAHILLLLNMIRPDVFVPGNHEFDFGPDIFRKRMSEARFPLLAANLRDAGGQRLPGFDDSRVIEIDGIRIGIVGLTAEGSVAKSNTGDLVIGPALEAGLAEAERLREAGVHIVVAAAHAARTLDRQLVDSRAFDIILSGDDHDLMLTYDGRTALVESFAQGAWLAALDVTIETSAGSDRVSWHPSFRVIDTADLEPDAGVQARVAGFESELSRELDVALGRTSTELDSRRTTVRTGEAAIGNLVADAMSDVVGAEIALMNGGGIRANRLYPPGSELRRKDILAELPFGNRVVKLEISGSTLRDALESGFARIGESDGRFPHIAGMQVELDPAAPPGKRLRSVTVGGAPLEPERSYVLATNDFLARGGDGYDMFVGLPRILNERDGPLLAAAVMAYIRKVATIAPAVDGRIRFAR